MYPVQRAKLRDAEDVRIPTGIMEGVLLTNEMAGSGGDSLPWMWQQTRIGPVIGRRTGGAGIGASSYQLIDGGSFRVPDWGWYDPRTGTWLMENRGVTPDKEDRSMNFFVIIAVALFSQVTPTRSATNTGEITFYQHIAWSPNGRQLATSAMKISRAAWEKEQFDALKKSQFDIYRVPIDGSPSMRVTDNARNDLWVTWWPGGKCLFFSSEHKGRSTFFFIKPDGSDVQGLSDDGVGSLNEPSVSTDGKRIAYTVREGPETHIYVAINGVPNRIKLTSTGPGNWGPVWSPDGKKILFYSNRAGRGRDQIFVVNADGSDEKQVTNDAFNNSFPSWSPDGRRILFSSNREGKGNEGIFVMNADGSNIHRFVPKMRAFFARWSPDGKKLAFIAGNFPETQIYLAKGDGSKPIQLTK